MTLGLLTCFVCVCARAGDRVCLRVCVCVCTLWKFSQLCIRMSFIKYIYGLINWTNFIWKVFLCCVLTCILETNTKTVKQKDQTPQPFSIVCIVKIGVSYVRRCVRVSRNYIVLFDTNGHAYTHAPKQNTYRIERIQKYNFDRIRLHNTAQ